MNLITLAIRNVRRNKFRSTLTIIGVAVAIIAFVLLRTVITSWNVAAEYAAKDRIATRHKVSFVITLPKHYIDVVRTQVPGVEAATWANWFGGRDPRNPDDFFATLAVDPESFLDVFPEVELAPEDRARWMGNRRGAIVGRSLAKKLKLKVGDRFTLEGSIYPGDWPFVVDGIYTASRKSVDQSQFIFHWDYLNESLPERRRDQIGWIMSRIDNPARSGAISRRIDRIFDERSVQTTTMSERALNLSFMAMLDAILDAIDIVSVIILLILVMILGNTVAMGVRERTHEYGVLQALGFEPSHVKLFIVGESMTTGLIAGVLGLSLAYPLVNLGMSRFIEENMGGFFPYFRIDPETGIWALLLAVGLGALSALVPALRASRLTVVDALRRLD